MQGERFGKTVGILIHKWSLLPRQSELPEHELVMGLPYPWKVLCKRRASRRTSSTKTVELSYRKEILKRSKLHSREVKNNQIPTLVMWPSS